MTKSRRWGERKTETDRQFWEAHTVPLPPSCRIAPSDAVAAAATVFQKLSPALSLT